jgi:hypothetical protein
MEGLSTAHSRMDSGLVLLAACGFVLVSVMMGYLLLTGDRLPNDIQKLWASNRLRGGFLIAD